MSRNLAQTILSKIFHQFQEKSDQNIVDHSYKYENQPTNLMTSAKRLLIQFQIPIGRLDILVE